MASMHCRDFVQASGEWMDGERNPAAVSHFSGCQSCRALIADLEMIRLAGSALPQEEPPAHLWLAIKSQLQKENLIRTPRLAWRERFSLFGPFRPALAGAYLSIVIVGALALGIHLNTSRRVEQESAWLQHAQKTMTPVSAELGSAEKTTLPVLQNNNDVTATLNRNLAIVDSMISTCEKSVRENPQNEMMRDYLYTAYQQKADLLAAAADSEGR